MYLISFLLHFPTQNSHVVNEHPSSQWSLLSALSIYHVQQPDGIHNECVVKDSGKTYPHEHVHRLQPVDTNGKRGHESGQSGQIRQFAGKIYAVEVVLENVN